MSTEAITNIKNQGVKKAQGMSNPLAKRLLTLKETAHYLGRSVWSVRELIWKGSIPYIQDGRKHYLDIRDLETYIETHKKILN
jgi:excisionase family DNA binding protein